jgi:hypothetical protein
MIKDKAFNVKNDFEAEEDEDKSATSVHFA